MAHDPSDAETRDLALTGLTVLGLAVAMLATWVIDLPPAAIPASLALAFAAGGIPPLLSALQALWHDHILTSTF